MTDAEDRIADRRRDALAAMKTALHILDAVGPGTAAATLAQAISLVGSGTAAHARGRSPDEPAPDRDDEPPT